MERIDRIITTDQVQRDREYYRATAEEIWEMIHQGKTMYVVDIHMVNKHHKRLRIEGDDVMVDISTPFSDLETQLARIGGIRGYNCHLAPIGQTILHTVCWEIGGGYA